MGEQLHFSMDGEFLTAIARDWFWKMDKPYKKCEELLLSCMIAGIQPGILQNRFLDQACLLD